MTMQKQEPSTDPRKDMWQYLKDKGHYTKSYDDFETQFGDENGVNALYDFVSGKRLYTNKLSDFVGKYYGDKFTVGSEGVIPIAQKKSPVGSSDSEDSSSISNAPIADADGSVQDLAFGEFGSMEPPFQKPPIEQEPEKERNVLKSFGKSVWNTLAYQIPAQLAAGLAATQDAAVYNRGPGGFVEDPRTKMDAQELQKQAGVSKKELIKWGLQHQDKNSKNARSLIQHIDQISDPIDAINYVFAAVGQGVPQIATTALTGGVTGYGQSIGGIYMDEVQRISEKTGLSPEEVIDNDLDDTATALAFGAVAGSLEYIGAGKVLSGLTKGTLKKALRGRAGAFLSAAASEGATEASQSVVEQIGSAIGAKDKVDINWKDVANEGLIGAISGGALSGGGQVSSKVVEKLEGDNVTIEKAQEIINEEKEEQATKEAPAERGEVEQATPELPQAETTQEQVTEEAAQAPVEPQESVQPTEESQVENVQEQSQVQQAVAREEEITKQLNPEVGQETQFGTVKDVVEDVVIFQQGDQEVSMPIDEYQAQVDTKNPFREGLTETQTQLVDRLSGNIVQESKPAKPRNAAVSNIQKALSQIGDFQVIEHDSNESIQQVAKDAGIELSADDTVGGIRIGNQIHINTKDAQGSTLSHEAIHPVLEAVVSEPAVMDRFYEEITKLPEWEQMKDIEGRYSPEEAKGEVVTEFMARIASGDIKPETSTWQKVKDMFTALVDRIGLGGKVRLDTEQDVVSFAKSLSRALNKGKVIEAQSAQMETSPQLQLLEKQNVLRARAIVQEFAPKIGPNLTEQQLINEVSQALNVAPAQVQDMITATRKGARTKFFNKKGPNPVTNHLLAPLKQFHSKYLLARRGAPKIVTDLQDGMNGAVVAASDNAKREVTRALKLAKKHNVPEADIMDAMTGQPTNMPTEVATQVAAMRTSIDKLSQMLIDDGFVYGVSKETIEQNLGKYLARQYRLFHDPKYKPTKQVRNRAVSYFKAKYVPKYQQTYPNATAQEIDAMATKEAEGTVEEILKSRDIPAKWSDMGGRNTDALKKKNMDLDPEVRELLGEYKHPLEAYVWTIYRLANLYYGTKMLSDLQAIGMNKFLFVKGDPRNPKPPEASIKLSGKNSEGFFPINMFDAQTGGIFDPDNSVAFNRKDVYTTPEVFEVITDSTLKARSWDAWIFDKMRRGLLGDVNSTWNTANGWINWGKTVGSVGTHVKNVLGNLPFLMSNGMINPFTVGFTFNKFRESLDAVLYDNGWKSKSGTNAAVVSEKLDYMKAHGLIGQNIAIGTIKDLMDSKKSPADLFESYMNKKRNLWDKAKKGLITFKQFLDKAYGAEDDVFKIFAFNVETGRYAKALYGKPYNQLTATEKAEVDDRAATIVKDILPNYGKLGPLSRAVSKSPILGNFIAFRVESMRVAVNSIRIMSDELRSSNAKVRNIGVSRMVGTAAAAGLRAGLVSYAGVGAGIGYQGLIGALKDDDEEKEKQEAIRQFLPSWLSRSDLVVHEAEDGTIRAHDFSGIDPYNAIQTIINASLYGEERLAGTIKEFFGGFVNETIMINAITGALSGIDNYNRRIWYPGDTGEEKWFEGSVYAGRTALPGTINTIAKIKESGGDANTIIGQFLGAAYYDVDTREIFGYKVDILNLPESGMRKKFRRMGYADATSGSLDDERMAEINELYKAELDELKGFYDAARKLGAPADDLIKVMKDRRLYKKEIRYVVQGQFTPWRKEEFLKYANND